MQHSDPEQFVAINDNDGNNEDDEQQQNQQQQIDQRNRVLSSASLFIPRAVPTHLPVGHPLRRLSLLSPEAPCSFKVWLPYLRNVVANNSNAASSSSSSSSPFAHWLTEIAYIFPQLDFSLLFLALDDSSKNQEQQLFAAPPATPCSLADPSNSNASNKAERFFANLSVPSIQHWFLAVRFARHLPTFLAVLSQRSVKEAREFVSTVVRAQKRSAAPDDDVVAFVHEIEDMVSANAGSASPFSNNDSFNNNEPDHHHHSEEQVVVDPRWQSSQHRRRVLRFAMWCSFIGCGVFSNRGSCENNNNAAASSSVPSTAASITNPPHSSSATAATMFPANVVVSSSPLVSQASVFSSSFAPLHVQLLLETEQHDLCLRTRIEHERSDEAEWGSGGGTHGCYGEILVDIRSEARKLMLLDDEDEDEEAEQPEEQLNRDQQQQNQAKSNSASTTTTATPSTMITTQEAASAAAVVAKATTPHHQQQRRNDSSLVFTAAPSTDLLFPHSAASAEPNNQHHQQQQDHDDDPEHSASHLAVAAAAAAINTSSNDIGEQVATATGSPNKHNDEDDEEEEDDDNNQDAAARRAQSALETEGGEEEDGSNSKSQQRHQQHQQQRPNMVRTSGSNTNLEGQNSNNNGTTTSAFSVQSTTGTTSSSNQQQRSLLFPASVVVPAAPPLNPLCVATATNDGNNDQSASPSPQQHQQQNQSSMVAVNSGATMTGFASTSTPASPSFAAASPALAAVVSILRPRPLVSLPIVFVPSESCSEIEQLLLPPPSVLLAVANENINNSDNSNSNAFNMTLDSSTTTAARKTSLEVLTDLYKKSGRPLSWIFSLLCECYTTRSDCTSQAEALVATAGKRLVVLSQDSLLGDGGLLERLGYGEVRRSETVNSATTRLTMTTSGALLGLRRSAVRSGNVLGRLLEEVRSEIESTVNFHSNTAATAAALASASASTGVLQASLSTTSFATTVATTAHHGHGHNSHHHHRHHSHHRRAAAALEAAAASGSGLRPASASSFRDLLASLDPTRSFDFRVQNYAMLLRPLQTWWVAHLAHYCGVRGSVATAQILALAQKSAATSGGGKQQQQQQQQQKSNAELIQSLAGLLQSARGPVMCAVVMTATVAVNSSLFTEESMNGAAAAFSAMPPLYPLRPAWCSWIQVKSTATATTNTKSAPPPPPLSRTELAAVDPDAAVIQRSLPDSVADYFVLPPKYNNTNINYSAQQQSSANTPVSTPIQPPRNIQSASGAAMSSSSPPTTTVPAVDLELSFHVRFDAFDSTSLEQMVYDARRMIVRRLEHSTNTTNTSATSIQQHHHQHHDRHRLLVSSLATGAHLRVHFGVKDFAPRILERLRIARRQENSLVCALMAVNSSGGGSGGSKNTANNNNPNKTSGAATPAAPGGQSSTGTPTVAGPPGAMPTRDPASASPASATTAAQRTKVDTGDISNKMSQLLSFLYLGSRDDAASTTILQEGITHVLNASHVRVFCPSSTLVTHYLGIPDVGDRSVFDIRSIFPVAFAFIDGVQKQHDEWLHAQQHGGVSGSDGVVAVAAAASSANEAALSGLINDHLHHHLPSSAAAAAGESAAAATSSLLQPPKILVHCEKGKSRSAAIVTAYLMRLNGWMLAEALHYIRQRRPGVEPNLGFLESLKEYESELEAERNTKRRALQVLLRNPAQSLSKVQLTRAMRLLGAEEVVQCSDRIASDGTRRVVTQFAAPGGASRAIAAARALAGRMTALGGRVWLSDFEEVLHSFRTG